jgi:sarcosine oxidase subunit gamma
MAEIFALPASARFSLRGTPDDLAAGCAAFVVPVPEVLRAATRGERAALWLGPDEFLLLGRAGAAAPGAGTVVDVGERQVGLAVRGAGAEPMLAAGCPLDLEMFPVGGCTRTLLGKADIVLWRVAVQDWRLEVWRSFAPYVRLLLEQAARDWP